MTEGSFSSAPARAPVALIDLVETRTPEAGLAFVTQATRLAEEAGGRIALANEALAPMILPDETSGEFDRAIGLLVITHFPTKQAAENALAKRQEGGSDLAHEQVRTFAAQPVRRIESFVGRALPKVLGLGSREPVPKIDDAKERDAVIEAALVLGEQPSKARWANLAERAGDGPIWMLNFLEYEKTAIYADDAQEAAPDAPISGADAYRSYGQGMVSSLGAVGGRVGWSGRMLGQLAGRDDGQWHQTAIAVYPSAAAMMTMLALPKYREAHVHRAAALARTRLLATRPLAPLSSIARA